MDTIWNSRLGPGYQIWAKLQFVFFSVNKSYYLIFIYLTISIPMVTIFPYEWHIFYLVTAQAILIVKIFDWIYAVVLVSFSDYISEKMVDVHVLQSMFTWKCMFGVLLPSISCQFHYNKNLFTWHLEDYPNPNQCSQGRYLLGIPTLPNGYSD